MQIKQFITTYYYSIFWLYPHYHAQFARQELMNRNFEISFRTMKATGYVSVIFSHGWLQIQIRM